MKKILILIILINCLTACNKKSEPSPQEQKTPLIEKNFADELYENYQVYREQLNLLIYENFENYVEYGYEKYPSNLINLKNNLNGSLIYLSPNYPKNFPSEFLNCFRSVQDVVDGFEDFSKMIAERTFDYNSKEYVLRKWSNNYKLSQELPFNYSFIEGYSLASSMNYGDFTLNSFTFGHLCIASGQCNPVKGNIEYTWLQTKSKIYKTYKSFGLIKIQKDFYPVKLPDNFTPKNNTIYRIRISSQDIDNPEGLDREIFIVSIIDENAEHFNSTECLKLSAEDNYTKLCY